MMKVKNIAVLGSTGSIGTQTLDVVRKHPELFAVKVLTANSSVELLAEQIREFSPEVAVLTDEKAAAELRSIYQGKTQILGGRQALLDVVVRDDLDTIVTALLGFAGLEPTLLAIDAGKNIALANKETLVVGGELVMKKAREKGVAILPVDSEHCALFQCLQGEKSKSVRKILLTASGGPFRGRRLEDLAKVTIADCLAHPTWSMGKKITVDSASLVNKGLEVIEAKWLYGVEYDQIEVVVHPQSIVHSMIEFCDGAVMAQLGVPDMRLPIQYALTYPERLPSPCENLDFWQMQNLTFEKPDMDTFRGLKLAYEAGKAGGTMPCLLNAANEVAVAAFLKGEIGFLQIYDIIEKTMSDREKKAADSLEVLLAEDGWAREYAKSMLEKA